MPARLLVIADDLTGALDTGVQFARAAVGTAVVIQAGLAVSLRGNEPVVVVDTESRHLAARQAAERVSGCVSAARAAGIDLFYKKTDSTLRGNVGAELAALLQSAGGHLLYFVPALPKAGRITRSGVQLVDGVPLHQSAFARDPRDPVRSSSIRDIIAVQSDVPVVTIRRGEKLVWPAGLPPALAAAGKPLIAAFDAETDDDLQEIADHLAAGGIPRLTAGCSGFAGFLPGLLDLPRGVVPRPTMRPPLLIVSGSLHPSSIAQLQQAEAEGVPSFPCTREHQTPVARIAEHLRADGVAMVRTDGVGAGKLVRALLREAPVSTIAVFGGDTAFSVIEALGIPGLQPLDEVSQGVVVSRVLGGQAVGSGLHLVTKAGGFGPIDLVARIRGRIGQEA